MSTTASADQALSVEVTTGGVGSLGTWSVGNGGVFTNPLRARIVVWNRNPGTGIESEQEVLAGQSVFAGDAWFRVREIQLPAGTEPGWVIFDPVTPNPVQAIDAGAVVLADGGRLRVDGPGIETAHDIRIVRWLPDSVHPVSADVEIWPALSERAGASPETVAHLQLKPGTHARLGHTDVSVLSVLGASAEHPAWVILGLERQD